MRRYHDAEGMQYVSTNRNETTDLKGVVSHCYAGDGSLYIPSVLPRLPQAFFNNISEMTTTEIAFVVLSTLLGDAVDAVKVKQAVEYAFSAPIGTRHLSPTRSVQELFAGPTLAFKDYSAMFMSAILPQIIDASRHVTVVTASTGNTGAAIANAFSGKDNVDVFVLFPYGSMKRNDLAQFAALAGNIHPLEVMGNISDCKTLAREAILDKNLEEKTCVISGNTNNILRILPQVVFFFEAYARSSVAGAKHKFSVSIPCGNLSNLTAAVFARQMGLPINHIIAGCNANDDFVRVLKGDLSPERVNRTSRPTLARAMDSGYPTNLPRLIALYGGDITKAADDIKAYSVCDDEIKVAINSIYDTYDYQCDPHTAVAAAAARMFAEDDEHITVLATAHPAKSLNVMTSITGRAVELPLQLTRFMAKPKSPQKLAPTYQALKKNILTHL